MNKTALTVLACLWIILFVGIFVYAFPAPRQWVLRVLALKEAGQSNVAGAALASQTGYSAPTDSGAIPTITDTSGATGTTTYQYKLLEDVDACSLNRLGAQGWHALQFGGSLVSSVGYDETCKRPTVYDTLDWVLFERIVTPSGQ